MHRSITRTSSVVRWILLPLLGLCVCITSQARAETLLRWKFVPKEVWRYINTLKMQQEMTVNEMPVKSVVNQTVDIHWTIDEVASDGSASMSQTIDRMQMEVQSWQQGALGQTIKVDSAAEEKPTDGVSGMIAPLVDALVGKPMTMRVSARGEISDFKVSEEMLEGLAKTPGAERMGGLFSADGLKQMANQAMLQFPEKQLAKGNDWKISNEITNPLVGKQEVATTYTYQGGATLYGKPVEVIGVSVETKIEKSKDATADIEVKEQKSTGTIRFDNALGRLIDNDSTTSMKMKITVNGMSFDQETSMKSTIKRKPGN